MGKPAVFRRRFRHAEIHFRGFCGAEIPVRTGVLHLIESFAEQRVVRFFTVFCLSVFLPVF